MCEKEAGIGFHFLGPAHLVGALMQCVLPSLSLICLLLCIRLTTT